MPEDTNIPVLVGAVPLLAVQSMSISEGYRVERIAGSRFSQAVAPTVKTIAIEATLTGSERLAYKKALEAMALTSRLAVSGAIPRLALGGIPVISATTTSLDMHITDLRFSQTAGRRDALDVSLTLQHVPRSSASEIVAELGDLALAAGTAAIPLLGSESPIARVVG
jgi:hypothetical protein